LGAMSDATSARATAFSAVAEDYDRGRPEYPADAVAWLVPAASARVVDLAAGTGKLTGALVAPSREVVAVEPLAEMLDRLRERLPAVRALEGSAEAIPLPDGWADALVVGQAYHWFDPDRALAEIARVLRPRGTLGLVWNTRDEAVPWVAALSAILRGRDAEVRAPDWAGDVRRAGSFGPLEHRRFRVVQRLGRDDLRAAVRSRSYVALMDEGEREALLAQVDALLDEDPALRADPVLTLPYVTEAFRATRLPEAAAAGAGR
jgi:SAM-dependent methyltransferase